MSQSSPFSFHCMICFEEFDASVHIPVVLPCAHTYICVCCANRLDKCTECRTSLFTTIPSDYAPVSSSNSPPSPPSSLSPTRTSNVTFSRSTFSQRLQPPPQTSNVPMKQNATTKVRVPLPKNVVLLSLMEAMDFASENALRASSVQAENDQKEGPFTSNPLPLDLSSSDTQEQREIDKIRLSTSIITGACGTYAVACKQGLIISEERTGTAFDPASGAQRQSSNLWDNEIDACLRSTSSFDSTPEKDSDKRGRGRKKTDPKVNGGESALQVNHMKLCFGDRVQVVSMVDGWAKLARGYGFIQCSNSNDLVKVGGPVDKACSLEAIINTLSLQRNRIKSEQTRLERVALVALREFQASLVRDEDLTVISSEAFNSPVLKDEAITVDGGNEKTLALQPRDVNRTQDALSSLNKSTGEISPIMPSNHTTENRTQTDNLTNGLISAARRILTDYGWTSVNSPSQTEPQTSRSVPMAHTPMSPEASRALLAGAESWRKRNGREAARGIDFRTGMSGHLGIQGHHAHPHDYVTNDHHAFPKMSMHSGLTVGPSQNNPSITRNMIQALNCSGTSATEILSFLSESDIHRTTTDSVSSNHDQILNGSDTTSSRGILSFLSESDLRHGTTSSVSSNPD